MKSIFLAMFFLLLVPAHTYAQTHISVEPAIKEILYGEKSGFVTVYNNGNDTVEVIFDTVYLTPQSTPMLVPDMSSNKPKEISFTDVDSPSISLAPGTNKQIRFEIATLPTSTEVIPGIIITTVSQSLPEERTATALSSAIVVPLIFLGHPSTQSVYINPLESSFFTSTGRYDVPVSITNPSYTSTIVQGTVRIKNIFGNVVDEKEISRSILLPQSSKEVIEYSWNPKLLIGAYFVDVEISYGEKVTRKSKLFVGIPLVYATSILLVSILGAGVYLRVKKYRR